MSEQRQLEVISGRELIFTVSGAVVTTDIHAYDKEARLALATIKTELTTDNDFIDAKKDVESCKVVEKGIAVSLAKSIAKMEEVNNVTVIANALIADFAKVRLSLDKLVKKEEARRKNEITKAGIDRVKKRIAESDVAFTCKCYEKGIIDSIKNKRLREKMEEAVTIEADIQILDIDTLDGLFCNNSMKIAESEKEYPGLFPDKKTIALSLGSIVDLEISNRVNDQKVKLQEKIESDRNIREAAELKVKEDAELKAKQDAEALRIKDVAEKVVVPVQENKPSGVSFGGVISVKKAPQEETQAPVFGEPQQEAPVFGDVGVFEESFEPVVKKSYRLTLEQITTIYSKGYKKGLRNNDEFPFTHIDDMEIYKVDVEEIIEELLGE